MWNSIQNCIEKMCAIYPDMKAVVFQQSVKKKWNFPNITRSMINTYCQQWTIFLQDIFHSPQCGIFTAFDIHFNKIRCRIRKCQIKSYGWNACISSLGNSGSCGRRFHKFESFILRTDSQRQSNSILKILPVFLQILTARDVIVHIRLKSNDSSEFHTSRGCTVKSIPGECPQIPKFPEISLRINRWIKIL